MSKICSICKKETRNYLHTGMDDEIRCFKCAGVKVGMVDQTKPRHEVCIPCEMPKDDDKEGNLERLEEFTKRAQKRKDDSV